MVAVVKIGIPTVGEAKVGVLPGDNIDNSSFHLVKVVVSIAMPEKVPLLPVQVPVFRDGGQRTVIDKRVRIVVVEQRYLDGSVLVSIVRVRKDTLDGLAPGKDEVVVQAVRSLKEVVIVPVKAMDSILEELRENANKLDKPIVRDAEQVAVPEVDY